MIIKNNIITNNNIVINYDNCLAFKNIKLKNSQCCFKKKYGDFCGKHKNYIQNGYKKIDECLSVENYNKNHNNSIIKNNIEDTNKDTEKVDIKLDFSKNTYINNGIINNKTNLNNDNIYKLEGSSNNKLINDINKISTKTIQNISMDDYIIDPELKNVSKQQLFNLCKKKKLVKLQKYEITLKGKKKRVKLNINDFTDDLLRLKIINYYNILLIGLLNINKVIKIQKYFRNYKKEKDEILHGPALNNRALCNNPTDFYNLEDLNEIENKYFFSYKDIDGFIYGFHIESFIQLINQNDEKNNPYNRNKISEDIQKNAKKLWIKLDNFNERTQITNITKSSNIKIRTRSELLSVFQKIDMLGYQTNINWVYNMSLNKLKILYRNLYNNWFFKSGLTNATRNQICPDVTIFSDETTRQIRRQINKYVVMEKIINIIDKLISSSDNQDNKNLSCIIVLMSIGNLNLDCVENNPWLS